MTPAELKAIRHHLGLSCQKLAALLGVASGRTIRKWEAGENDNIPGPAERLLLCLRHDKLTIVDVYEAHAWGAEVEGLYRP